MTQQLKSLLRRVFLGVLLLAGGIATSTVASAETPIDIGILAIRPKTEMLTRWQPLADYLSAQIPGYRFRVHPLDHGELSTAIQQNSVDFIFTNPAYYIELRSRYQLTFPLVTLIDYGKTFPVSAYGGVIFTHSKRSDINTLDDLRDKKIAIVNRESLGGYQSQALELHLAGIDLDDAIFIPCGLPHERTIEAVLSGRADAGFIRSGMIEELETLGRLDSSRLKIINRRTPPDYPLMLSTRLYPQWPLLAVPKVEDHLARQVAAALLNLEHDSDVTRKGGYHGFSVPADYAAVETLLRTLRLPPYDAGPEFSEADVWQRYQRQIILSGVAVSIILLLSGSLVYANRRLSILRHQAIKDSERLKEAQHLAHLGSWELDLTNNQLTWSDEIFTIFEIDRKRFSATYEAFLQTIHPDDRPLVDAAYQKSLTSGEPYVSEHRLLLPDGRIKHVREEGETLFDSAGHPLRSIGTVQDITEQQQQQRLLLESEERYQRFTSLTSDFVHLCERTADHEFHVRWLAGSVQKLTGYTPDEFMTMGCWLQILHPDDLPEAAMALRKLAPGESEAIEFRIIRKDGEERWLKSNSYCTLNTEDHVVLYGTISDISDRKHYEEMILDASFAAMEANRAKSEFLANMSHEIRTPMNGIIGMSQLLHFTELTAEQQDYLDNIEGSAANLLALINDILDLSKIEAGKAEIAPADFSLREVVSSAIKTQLPRIKSKGLQLSTDIPAEVPDTLFGDDLRLKQILLNLLSNATKFTDSGKIAVAVRLTERHHDQVLLCFSVQDSGIGIPPAAHKTIFSPFCQGDSSTTRRFGGTGLGLSICRKLLDLMGGKIWLESAEGRGSTFFFELPFAVGAGVILRDRAVAATPNLALKAGPPLKILIAEDNEINSRLASLLLQKLGHSPIQAVNGKEAVALWRSTPVDVILMDVQMPDVDGVEALHMIRAEEGALGRHTPVIALTAHALVGDRERFLAEGFDSYLTKPFSLDRLAQTLQEIQLQR